MAGNELLLGEMKPDAVFAAATKQGVSQHEAAILVSEWILQLYGEFERTFNFSKPLADSDPNCASRFQPQFAHQDWVDGESVVQASKTPGENGFNFRFHRIEDDLKALGADTAMAFACLAQLRKDLRALLDEIRAELNRINHDIHECCHQKASATVAGGPVEMVKFLGYTKVNDNPMHMWQTSTGVMLTPALESTLADPLNNPRARRPGTLARFIAEEPGVRAAFPQAVSVKDFLVRFGDNRTPDGTVVRDLVVSLPPEARYENLDRMLDEVTEREASALRTTTGAREAVASVLGLDPATGAIGTASIEKFEVLPAAARTALRNKGIDTIGKLAAAGTGPVLEALESERVTGIGAGEVAEWATRAKALSKLR